MTYPTKRPFPYANVAAGRTRPLSLTDPQEFLSNEACKALLHKIVGMTTGGGSTSIAVRTSLTKAATWARNRTQYSADEFSTRLIITRQIRGAYGGVLAARLDDAGLQHAVRMAEQLVQTNDEQPELRTDPFVDEPTLQPVLWSDLTAETDADKCTDIAQQLMAPADDQGMLSAGELRTIVAGTAVLDTAGLARYYKTTEAQCSMTVRNKTSTGSGWAGMNHYDLAEIDPNALAARALDKALRSANPVAVEPGRYTTILEPQAMSDLFAAMIDIHLDSLDPLLRPHAEQPAGPFGQSPGLSKITQQVMDSRMTLRCDPMDPDGGFIPFDEYDGTPYRGVNWIDQGVLKDLAYSKRYALAVLGYDKALLKPYSYRLTPAPSVATSTIDEMIAKTERGVLVTRLSNVRLVDPDSFLEMGYTRDGLWLIEHGKITKPIKNFRFNESPVFVLNNLEDIGTPQRVFNRDGNAYVAPAVRVRDFSFTALADAI